MNMISENIRIMLINNDNITYETNLIKILIIFYYSSIRKQINFRRNNSKNYILINYISKENIKATF